jgi:hypothetical protein
MNITIAGQTLTAAVCPIRGCRVYPPEHLPAHLERHQTAYERDVGQRWLTHGNTPKHVKGWRAPRADPPRAKRQRFEISGRNHRNVRPDEVVGYLSALEQYVRNNPGLSLAAVVKQLEHPFFGDNSARDCISRSIKAGRVGIELRKNGRFTELWAR